MKDQKEETTLENELGSPLDMLTIFFTNLSKHKLVEVLEDHHYDLQATVDYLQNSENDMMFEDWGETDEESTTKKKKPEVKEKVEQKEKKGDETKISPECGGKPICKFFIGGGCHNKSCTFLHVTPSQSSDSYVKTEPTSKSKNSKSTIPVCKYFLQGQCLVVNCPFKHETDLVLCKYYLLGNCMRGNECAYTHALDFNDVSSKIEKASVKLEPSPPTEQIFTPIPKKKPKILDLANKIKLKQIQDKYPERISTKITQIFWETNFDQDKTLQIVTDQFGSPTREDPSVINPVPSVVHTTKTPNKVSKSIKWVETGAALGDLYKQYRDEAIYHAQQRNMFFQGALRAYLSGNGAEAKRLSKLGREQDNLMRNLHKDASQKIYDSRNSRFSHSDYPVVDLHGLHVKEAIEFLETKIKEFNEKRVREFFIIVGTGHHTHEGFKSRLNPGIIKYLQTKQYKYVDASDDKMGGMLRVKLT